MIDLVLVIIATARFTEGPCGRWRPRLRSQRLSGGAVAARRIILRCGFDVGPGWEPLADKVDSGSSDCGSTPSFSADLIDSKSSLRSTSLAMNSWSTAGMGN
jgi:hypothetical protein